MSECLMVLLGLVALVAYYLLARMDNIIGLILRTIWNFWFKLFSLIPLLGWMSHFIITKNEEDETRKKEFQKEAAIVREENAKLFSEYTEKKIAETAERKAQLQEQQQQKLQEEQDWIRKQAWQQDGRKDVEFSKDGTRWKYQDESWDNSRHI